MTPVRSPRILESEIHQLEVIGERVATAADAAREALRRVHSPDSDLEVMEVASCALADCGQSGVLGDGDLIAGVMLRFQGALCATALLALEPANALAWARAVSPCPEPVARFVALGEALLGPVVMSIAGSLDLAETEPGPASLEERPVIEILVGTHAPSDTAILSLVLAIMAGDVCVPARVYLLLEPKLLLTLRDA